MERYSLGFVFFEDEVLLMRKSRPLWQKGLLNGVGGKSRSDELSVDTMVREFKEETGITIEKESWTYVLLYLNFKYDSYISVYKVKLHMGLGSEVGTFPFVRKTDEPVMFYNMKNIRQQIVPDLEWILPLITSDLVFPITLFKRKK